MDRDVGTGSALSDERAVVADEIDQIEAWFVEGAALSARLRRLIAAIGRLSEGTLIPSHR